MDWKNKLINFWSGRYGADALGNGLFILSVVLAAVNIFVRSVILQTICFGVLLRNISAIYALRHVPAVGCEYEYSVFHA